MPASSSSAPTRPSTRPRAADATGWSSTEPEPVRVQVLGAPRGPHAAAAAALLLRYDMQLALLPEGDTIPGSYWGGEEAGLVGARLYARADTPLHSVLHEACHDVCMTPARRATLDTYAGGDDLEECAVCYLSVLLADMLPGLGQARMLADMDAWGHGFRLGSARAWFREVAEDARRWLLARGLVERDDRPTFRLRREP